MLNFQTDVKEWTTNCFGTAIAEDKVERNFRFFEEATELVQATGMTKEQCLKLVDYVFDRPVGQFHQELGGVMVVLAALSNAYRCDMLLQGEVELNRCWNRIDKIRAKQAAKTIKSGYDK